MLQCYLLIPWYILMQTLELMDRVYLIYQDQDSQRLVFIPIL